MTPSSRQAVAWVSGSMAASFRKLVVRAYSPKIRAAMLSTAVLAGIAVLYGAFELGRYDAGYRVIDAVRGALAAGARIRSLETQNSQLRAQLAASEVARRVDHEGYSQVEHNLGDMQNQIARLSQDLAFLSGAGPAGLRRSRESATDANRAGHRR